MKIALCNLSLLNEEGLKMMVQVLEAKAANGGVLWKKVFLKISVLQPDFPWILRNFEERFFYRTQPGACF